MSPAQDQIAVPIRTKSEPPMGANAEPDQHLGEADLAIFSIAIRADLRRRDAGRTTCR